MLYLQPSGIWHQQYHTFPVLLCIHHCLRHTVGKPLFGVSIKKREENKKNIIMICKYNLSLQLMKSN